MKSYGVMVMVSGLRGAGRERVERIVDEVILMCYETGYANEAMMFLGRVAEGREEVVGYLIHRKMPGRIIDLFYNDNPTSDNPLRDLSDISPTLPTSPPHPQPPIPPPLPLHRWSLLSLLLSSPVPIP